MEAVASGDDDRTEVASTGGTPAQDIRSTFSNRVAVAFGSVRAKASGILDFVREKVNAAEVAGEKAVNRVREIVVGCASAATSKASDITQAAISSVQMQALRVKACGVEAMTQTRQLCSRTTADVAATISSTTARAVGIMKRASAPMVDRVLHYVPSPVKTRASVLIDFAAAKTLAANEFVSNKTHAVCAGVQAGAKNPKIQVTVAGGASGAVAGGAGGAAVGITGGSMAGAMAGVPFAFFTFGLSIPVMATLGGAAGCCVGATVGGASGLLGGSAIGGAYANKEEIRDGATKTVTAVGQQASETQARFRKRAADCEEFVKETAATSRNFVIEKSSASKAYMKEKVTLVKGKLGSGTGGTH